MLLNCLFVRPTHFPLHYDYISFVVRQFITLNQFLLLIYININDPSKYFGLYRFSIPVELPKNDPKRKLTKACFAAHESKFLDRQSWSPTIIVVTLCLKFIRKLLRQRPGHNAGDLFTAYAEFCIDPVREKEKKAKKS